VLLARCPLRSGVSTKVALSFGRGGLPIFLGVAGVLIFWLLVLRLQMLMRKILTEFPEADPVKSPCGAALYIAAERSIRGLFILGLSVVVLLQAVLVLPRPVIP
jgi:hypothetical protein